MKYFSSWLSEFLWSPNFQVDQASIDKFEWHINGVVLWSHMTNRIHISTCRRHIDTKPGKVMTSTFKTAWHIDHVTNMKSRD